MSEKFNGFSQDEINRVSGGKNKKPPTTDGMKPTTFRGHGGIRRMPDKSEYLRQQKVAQTKQSQPGQSKVTSEKNSNVGNQIIEKLQSNDSLEDINIDNSISKSLQEALFYQPLKSRQQSDSKVLSTREKDLQGQEKQITPMTEVNTQSAPSAIEDSSILKLSIEINGQKSSSNCTDTLDDSSILPSLPDDCNKRPGFTVPSSLNLESPFKGISLKDFENHRKMIEEQNRQKKEILYKAIEQHSQKTAAEARKIEEIKSELAKLDNDLAIDVALLRKQIDNACIHFANVEKHYIKIESQFLKAKIDLHNASEKKELLTEHLCTVIAHNEDRKAQKLSELMEKVGLATNNDYEPPKTALQ